MADETVLDQTELLDPSISADAIYMIKDYDGTAVDRRVFNSLLLGVLGFRPGGRITLETGVPRSYNTSVSAATTVYYTPYIHNSIPIYDPTNSAWKVMSFSELSIAVPSTTDTNYDLFAYDNSGTVALEVLAWTDDTNRATAISFQDGHWVKSTDKSRLALGTFRTTGVSGQTEDTRELRLVSNLYNEISKRIYKGAAGGTHIYSTSAWRAWNNDTDNHAQVVLAKAQNVETTIIHYGRANSTGNANYGGIGLDSTSSAELSVLNNLQYTAYGNAQKGIMISEGFHKLYNIEYGSASNCYFYTHIISIRANL